MFGDILGNMQKQQAELQSKLGQIIVEAEAGDGAITVRAGADMHIENIRLDASKINLQDQEQLEDLLVVAVNRALEAARAKAGAETGQMIKDMFPFGDLDQFLKP